MDLQHGQEYAPAGGATGDVLANDGLVTGILCYLDLADLLRATLVSKLFKQNAHRNEVWAPLIGRRWPGLAAHIRAPLKTLFKSRYMMWREESPLQLAKKMAGYFLDIEVNHETDGTNSHTVVGMTDVNAITALFISRAPQLNGRWDQDEHSSMRVRVGIVEMTTGRTGRLLEFIDGNQMTYTDSFRIKGSLGGTEGRTYLGLDMKEENVYDEEGDIEHTPNSHIDVWRFFSKYIIPRVQWQ